MNDLVDTFEFVEMYICGTTASGKTAVFAVRNRHHGDELGTIIWYGPWHQYVFRADTGTLYSNGCLRDIATFVAEQTEIQRRGRLRSWPKARP